MLSDVEITCIWFLLICVFVWIFSYLGSFLSWVHPAWYTIAFMLSTPLVTLAISTAICMWISRRF